MRVFALLDIPVGYEPNPSWNYSLSSADFQKDLLILAGDVSYDLKIVREILVYLQTKFKEVFFVRGNHDLWIWRSAFIDSLEKFHRLMKMCRSMGADVSPAKIGGGGASKRLWIVPLFFS